MVVLCRERMLLLLLLLMMMMMMMMSLMDGVPRSLDWDMLTHKFIIQLTQRYNMPNISIIRIILRLHHLLLKLLSNCACFKSDFHGINGL